MKTSSIIKCGLLATSAGFALCQASAALAQEASDAPAASAPTLDEIVVTATKRGQASNVQDVPFAVTAFGAQQLEDQHFTTVQSLSYNMPNVQLNAVGTTPGYANFSIRGLGINSSIPSIDPTVGVFMDGVYLGVSAGVVFGNFDIEGLEVLRGPQGLLFGRNVTGGAMVIRTTTPKDTFSADLRASVSSGPEYKISGVVTGPIVQDKISAKLAVYYDKDTGYYVNDYNNNHDLGKNRTLIVRPALRFTPIDGFESVFRYEYGKYDGDGAVASNHGLYPRNSFHVNIDEEGFAHNYWHMASNETNIDTAFGDGKITNIMAYREYNARVFNDIDASPSYAFHSGNTTHQKQMSEELRWAGTFGKVDVTTGLYYFTQRIDYKEVRKLSNGARTLSGGGIQNQDTYGIFGSADWHFTDTLTLNLGARYTTETKDVKVANLTATGCDYDAQTCNYTFNDKHTWKGLTPRIGMQWQPDSQTQVYGFWTRGFRSGGYNFRNVYTQVDPGPFNDEVQNSWEVGVKKDLFGIARINLAAFWNTIDDVQREIQIPVVGVGTAQVITNSANARIRGLEGEFTLKPGAGFTLTAQAGYTEGKYTDVFYDLNNDGVIDAKDYGLKLPRLAPWSYGGTVAWSGDFGDLGVDARVSANYRDADWYNDANTGLMRAATMVDANLTFKYSNYSLSFYGTNLLNEATFGAEAPLAFFSGSTFSPLNKGRVYGVEVAAKF